MPLVSRFFGISIYMYFDDHNPPHFHAIYSEYEAIVGIEDLTIIHGMLPPRALGLVIEWASQHQQELIKNWNNGRNLKPLDKIEPLK